MEEYGILSKTAMKEIDMITVSFYELGTIEDQNLKFAVICTKYRGKWIFCRHKARSTWEIPGGHCEAGEAISQTASRELTEETGAKSFSLHPLTVYCVETERETTYGMLFFAEVKALGELSVQSEIGEITLSDTLLDELTYPLIQPFLHTFALQSTKPCHSYVMGMDDEILSLAEKGFDINRDGENYTVTFPKILASEWERFVSKHLKYEYWNEYFADDQAVFLFHLKDGIERYEVENYHHPEVLALCQALCGCKFPSLKEMLLGNWFYRQAIEESLTNSF
jgi:8-oxo-dGTP diphosphatase